ncbi:hypothetical protein WMY93_007422 [Mugilogobius chulae]|uniref:Transmembrane protein 120A n=1 Tax=Mugilogobius chulae TaxID=88201 RepID=A0AAW0PG08_9GOBI
MDTFNNWRKQEQVVLKYGLQGLQDTRTISCQSDTAGIVENLAKRKFQRAANLISRHKELHDFYCPKYTDGPKLNRSFSPSVQLPSMSPDPDPDLDLNQEIPATPQIKEEPEEQSIKQEEEQLHTSVPESNFICVKIEDSFLLEQTQTKEETHSEDISSVQQFHSETDGDTEHSSDNDDEDWNAPLRSLPAQIKTETDGDNSNQVQITPSNSDLSWKYNGFTECLQEWGDLDKDYQHLQEIHRLYKQKLEEVTKLQNSCSSVIARQRKKIQELSASLEECKGNPPPSQLSPDDVLTISEIQDSISERSGTFLEMEAFCQRKTGNVNVTLLNKQAKALDAMFNFLLVWYYCTLTIRESILINNGSRIKGWWVFHHYVSTFLSGVMLTWPEGVLYQMFRNQFLAYCMYQSFVQFLQYYYQSGCLYRLRALGERHTMDLTVEGFQSWMWRGLSFLLPFLFFGHFWQFYNSITLFKMFQLPNCKEWQVVMCGCSYLVLFMGNFFTTLGVVYQKYMNNQDKSKSL